jgi:zinc transport system substrate-binding protein
MRFLKQLVLILACILVPITSPSAAALKVTVSVLPQAYFVQQIAGNLAEITVMVLPGASPATYEPKPNQMRALSASVVYFAVGAPFETVWMEKIRAANPGMSIVPTHKGVTKIPMARHLHDHPETTARDHAHDRNHTTDSQTVLDPHIWLAPGLVSIQARNICQGLTDADPAHRDIYAANLAAFEAELTRLDASIRNILGDTTTTNHFLVFHPAWGYFAKEYGLIQIPVEIEGKSPSPRDLGKLISLARTHEIDTVFVQPQFSQKSARVIADAIDGHVIRLDPLAENWAENLIHAAKSIKEALR